MTSTVDPLVTIITPSFNQARFLRATLESVSGQDYPNVEHIVLDGASTDGSVELLREWASTHSIQWTSQPDGGQADAIQQGVALARGEIIAWLNSDDTYLYPGVISDVVAEFRRGARIVSGGGWYLNEGGRPIAAIPVEADRLAHATLRYVDWILQPATFVEAALMRQCPLDVTLHYAFDWDLFIRLTALAPAVPIYKELAGYRIHQSGKTVSGGARRQRELLRVVRRYHGRRSRAYLMLLPVVAGHELASMLPPRLGRKVAFVLNQLAIATLRLLNGRGIQP